MKKIEFITDPSTNKLSASRLCLLIEVGLAVVVIALCALRIIPKEYGWLGTMLAGMTAATCTVYGVSTYTSGNFGIAAFVDQTLAAPPPIAGIQKAKTP